MRYRIPLRKVMPTTVVVLSLSLISGCKITGTEHIFQAPGTAGTTLEEVTVTVSAPGPDGKPKVGKAKIRPGAVFFIPPDEMPKAEKEPGK